MDLRSDYAKLPLNSVCRIKDKIYSFIYFRQGNKPDF